MTHKLLNYSPEAQFKCVPVYTGNPYHLPGCPTQILFFPNYCVALGGRKT